MGCRQSKNIAIELSTNTLPTDQNIDKVEVEKSAVTVEVEKIESPETNQEEDHNEEVNEVNDVVEEMLAQTSQLTEQLDSASDVAIEMESDGKAGVFVSRGIITKGGITYYQYSTDVLKDTEVRVTITKRYNEFSSLYRKVEKLMVRHEHVPSNQSEMFKTYPALPALPRPELAPFWYGSNSAALKKRRESHFLEILNTISRHPVARNSSAFQEFLR